MKRKLRFTLADDDANVLFLTQCIVSQVYPNSVIASFTNTEDALHHVLGRGADMVITDDHGMGFMTGTEMIRQLRKHGFTNPILMVSGLPERKKEALAAGANHFMLKTDAPPKLAIEMKKFLAP